MKKDKDYNIYNKNIEEISIYDFTDNAMRIFAGNINVMRHIPALVDGLKPVERRILYTLYSKLKSTYKGPTEKVPLVSGTCMGYFHPHGEIPIQESMVRMAQPWVCTQPLLQGFGNFGSPTGDEAGAGRYTETKLSFYSYKCFFEDFDLDVLDTTPNYLNRIPEPIYLPAKYPNVLINNTFGIGFGMKTHIPNFNIREILNLTIRALQEEDITKEWLYPDIVTGATILDEGQFPELCIKGRQKYTTRGVIIKDTKNHMISIQSLPMLVTMQNILETIQKEIDDGKILGLKDIRDMSKGLTIDMRLYFKPEVDLDYVINHIYKKTRLQDSDGAIFLLIHNFKPQVFNLSSIIGHWIEFRETTLRRTLTMKLSKVYERLHILEILLFILNADNIEKTMNIIRHSNTKSEMVNALIENYNITSLKAEAISNLKLGAFNKESVMKYHQEFIDKKKEVKSILSNLKEKNLKKLIIKQLEEGIDLFGEDRRSQVVKYDKNKPIIPNTEHIIVISKRGYIKKLPKNDNIKNIGYLEQGDYPTNVLMINNTSEMIIFDSYGKKSSLFVHQIPNSILQSKGVHLKELVPYYGDIIRIDTLPLPKYILSITKDGLIKKSETDGISTIGNGTIYTKLNEKDKVVDIQYIDDEKQDILVYTKQGLAVRFSAGDVPCTSRNSKGVLIMKMNENDSIIGINIIPEVDKYVFIVTEKGYVKKIALDNLQVKKRNTKPMILLTLNENDLITKAISIKEDREFKIFKSSGLEYIDSSKIKVSTRKASPKKIIPVRLGDTIIDVI